MKSHKYKNLEELAPNLPTHCYSVKGKQMEPITLIILGNKKLIQDTFKSLGWYKADSIGFISGLKSAIATVFNKSYRTGPMWPSFVNGKKHQLGFEKPTQSDTYRRRHHLRFWRTNFKLNGSCVWLGMLSYDRGIGLMKNSLYPTHHINPDLSYEEDFLGKILSREKPVFFRLCRPEKGVISVGDPYTWDGRALVIDLSQ